jgi:dipeptidase E
MRLLLISNSYSYGKGYLDHCADEICSFLEDIEQVVFIPYALFDHNKYTELVKSRFSELGIDVIPVHTSDEPIRIINKAEAIFVGGGNSFRLLNALYDKCLIDQLRSKVVNHTPFIGASAGANIVCPTIKTTNDMPIVYPPSLNALNLIPFQINPHYFDPEPTWSVMMESRAQRINQFHEENDTDVLGLREDSFLRVEGDILTLKGRSGARLFRKGEEPQDFKPVVDMNFLLRTKNEFM